MEPLVKPALILKKRLIAALASRGSRWRKVIPPRPLFHKIVRRNIQAFAIGLGESGPISLLRYAKVGFGDGCLVYDRRGRGGLSRILEIRSHLLAQFRAGLLLLL